jgi:PIN domain nuclease of toxin-antitoxin system
MSRLLLDTQVVVWWDDASASLGADTASTIRNARDVYVSAASEWELTIKAALGKLRRQRTIEAAALAAHFELLPVTFEHARATGTLKPIHRDPFDRLLVAVAITEDLTIVSSDAIFARYPVRVIDARR